VQRSDLRQAVVRKAVRQSLSRTKMCAKTSWSHLLLWLVPAWPSPGADVGPLVVP
jgi:hypothetical protein